MLEAEVFQVPSIEAFKQKALYWSSKFTTACYFDSNGFKDPYSAFDVLIAAGAKRFVKCNTGKAFRELSDFIEQNTSYLPGFLSYDLKNETEDLQSNNTDNLQFPDLYFFEPLHLILIKGEEVRVISSRSKEVISLIKNIDLPEETTVKFRGTIESRFTKAEYIDTVHSLQDHIHRGEIYETNFCQEFYAENASLDPVSAYIELSRISPTPFSNFFRMGDHYILSATPERFLSRRGSKLISQPIKGTAKRQQNPDEDEKVKNELRLNEKELAENVMIVDLVRNDLTKSAVPGTVTVEELFGVYTFRQVHQMISTVVCVADKALNNAQIIKNTFPMGSMTGAPKISAMKLIDKYERTRRGVYSGTVGYFSPEGDFDFNVIIRSMLYNAKTGYLSFQVGSAITGDSNAEKEYKECLLKAKAIFQLLGVDND
ncbi:anthranilate synthase component I family protein [Flavihumibacter sp. R14]|nr:anthranilate synthase component I family protein [Flavihumibacter soli]